MSDTSGVDEIDSVAQAIVALQRPVLLVFDCDGVLAPLTDHADDSVLTEGVGEGLRRLTDTPDAIVAILSGRSLDGLAQFGFDDSIIVAGSYGGERRGVPTEELTGDEQRLLEALDTIAVTAVDRAGPGAWVERKPTSVVIHVREADVELGAQALASATEALVDIRGHESHEGSNVLELMARPTDKGHGLRRLISDTEPGGTVYLGDDVPDEDAFAVLGAGDVSVKVGPGPTVATHRLSGPESVAALIDRLGELLV